MEKTRVGPRHYMRCALCGHLANIPRDGSVVPERFHADHEIEVNIQHSGGRGVFFWTTREMSRDELAALSEVLRGVFARVRGLVDKKMEGAASREEFDELASLYMMDAGRAVDDAQAELEFRQGEVEQLAKDWAAKNRAA